MSEESVKIKTRIRELVDMIKKYDEAYFNQLEKKYPEFKVNKTPTEIGYT